MDFSSSSAVHQPLQNLFPFWLELVCQFLFGYNWTSQIYCFRYFKKHFHMYSFNLQKHSSDDHIAF